MTSDVITAVGWFLADLVDDMTPVMWALVVALVLLLAWMIHAARRVCSEERPTRRRRRRAAPPRLPIEEVRPAAVPASAYRELPACSCARCQRTRDDRVRRAIQLEHAVIIQTGETNPRRAWAAIGGPRV